MNTERDFDNAAEQWLRKHRYTGDTQVLAKISRRVHALLEQNGGYVSTAHYHRAYLELVAEKSIQPFRGTVTEHVSAAAAIPQDAIDLIERGSAFEQRRRYANDPAFKRHYDAYVGQQKTAQESPSGALSVEEYGRLPAAIVAQRYQEDRLFKASVDKLIAEGKI
jgi:hypothetical protein